MGGKSSRDKGKRGEYAVRDYFRARGWDSHRVPLSGASFNHKGDVTLVKGDIKLTAEVKFRRDDFLSIYALIDNNDTPELALSWNGKMLIASYEFRDLGFEDHSKAFAFNGVTDPDRTTKKLFNLQKLVKGCDFLVVKCNFRPLLFIRYWGDK